MGISFDIKTYFKEMNWTYKLIILMAFINPFAYLINPNVLGVLAVLEVAVIFLSKEEFYKKFWRSFILAITFYGVSVFHVKLYYWVFILCFPIIFYMYRNRLNKRRLIYLGAYLIFIIYLGIIVLVNPIKGYIVAEYIRYVMCFVVLAITFMTFRDLSDVKYLFGSFRVITLATIISALIIAGFTLTNFMDFYGYYTGAVFNISIFMSKFSFRGVAFFSDPNVLYSVFIFMLAIYEFIKFIDYREKVRMFDITNILFFIVIVLSGSRTAAVVIALYIVVKFIALFVFKRNLVKNNIAIGIFLAIFLAIFLIFSTHILDIINWILYKTTILMGRSHSLEFSGSFTGSSRMKSWVDAMNSIKGHWWFGRGLNYWKEIYYMPPHNSIIMMIQSAGVISLAMISGLFIYAVRKIPVFISIILIIVPMCTLDLQQFVFFAIFVGIGVIAIDSEFSNSGRPFKLFN